ncbi:uncharacterized protein LOC132903995 [Amyelois transitella]|uniref:uncharacterized protein LOC132903788 n=1 Tax=Amyelois transitella TaxID=680683 RepID=UPI00298FF97E|nr:uncharacterized protein LOC132903788 [Amyelois transitella]XP_060809841.1 uncharacterized protein LOC132903995 [Amyelois transitella]
MASKKTIIPQEGTDSQGVGESLPTPSGVGCPTVSGGGTYRQRDASPSQLSTRSTSRGSLILAPTSDEDNDSLPEVIMTEDDKNDGGSVPRKRKALEGSALRSRGPKINTATRGRHAGRRTQTSPPKPASSIVDEQLDVVRTSVGNVLEEAGKSGNLKGTVWRSMKDACQHILDAADKIEMHQEESAAVRILTADNRRMREQLAQLEQETRALRKAYAEKSTGPSTSGPVTMAEIKDVLKEFEVSIERNLFLKIGEMVTTRLNEAEKRGILAPEPILRPPLAADRKKQKAGDLDGREGNTGSTLMPPARPGPVPQTRAKAKAKTKARPREPTPGPSRIPPTEASPNPGGTEVWTTVARKKKGKRKGKGKPTQAPKAAAKPPPRKAFTPPKSAAVVVTLKPESDMDYKSIMAKVTTIKLPSIGVDHVSVRRSATGARIIEVPGADSGAAADALAEKVRELIGNEAEISRPYKTAQVKVSGFDEAVTLEALREAAGAAGKCPPGQIKVGAIRMAPDQTGAAILTCPVAAANSLIELGRLLVGWSAAKVKGLEALPMRCFRCMGMGHTRALCPSPVDRSSMCHRCGKTGHTTGECQVKEPWCAVCHAAKLPPGHVMGGKACNPPRIRGKSALATTEASEGRAMEH